MVHGISVVSTAAERTRWLEDTATREAFETFTIFDATSCTPLVSFRDSSTRVVQVARRDTVEEVLAENWHVIPQGWVFRIDPDEFLSPDLIRLVQRVVRQMPGHAVLALPFQYYVGHRPLRGGVWGGVRDIPRVIHSSAHPSADVHASLGRDVRFIDRALLPSGEAGCIKHVWVQSLQELDAKHRRYLTAEGRSRLATRGVWTWTAAANEISRSLLSAFVRKRPFRDGRLGLQLAARFVVYQWRANSQWRRETRARTGDKGEIPRGRHNLTG